MPAYRTLHHPACPLPPPQASLRDPTKTVAEIVKETIAAVGENVQIRRFVKFNLGEGMVKKR